MSNLSLLYEYFLHHKHKNEPYIFLKNQLLFHIQNRLENIYKKAENLFFDFGLVESEDCIYVCDQTGKKIKRYNGVDWNIVL